jgi:hypothetical protein
MQHNHQEVLLIEKLLANLPKKHSDVKSQMLYERGYLTGMLAMLAHNDSHIRATLIRCLTQTLKR